MSSFVLVHGAWHGAWCWHKVIPLLRASGAKVVALDLPGLGVDRTPLQGISFQSYVDRVCAALDASDEPVTLVGHSMGGTVITQAAESRPNKIRTLVYLTAFLIPDGRSMLEELQSDALADIVSHLRFSDDQSVITLDPQSLKQLFYADCSASDLALAEASLVPQAAAPLTSALQTSTARWGSVPRVYIECTDDAALSLAAQRAMVAQLPCRQVYTMQTSHSPFLSAPEALSTLLLSL